MSSISAYKKLLGLVTLIYLGTLGGVVIHYQFDPSPIYLVADARKIYSVKDIKDMIKKLPNYQGDSITIDSYGKLTSLNGLIQSTLNQVYSVSANIEAVKNEAKITGLPEPFLVYKIGIEWYLEQHGNKTKSQTDSIKVN